MVGRVWVGILAALSALAAAGSGAAEEVDLARVERAIDVRVSSGQFMGSVLVARDGWTLLSKGYGMASLADKTANTPTTKFRLGSLTRQFTAASILLLEERGKLKVEDPVKKHMPDAPAAWGSITIYNLLTHTSGISNSNSGYVLLGYLIEKISGEPYAKFVQENLFAPLGMNNSGYDSDKIPGHAIGYAPGPAGPVVAPYIDMTIPFSAGALYSTAEDLLRWESGLFGGKVLKPASLEKMITPFRNNYAFGLMVQPGPNGGKIISHNGGIEGFNTKMTYVTSDKVAVIVLANLSGPAADTINDDIRKVAEQEPGVLLSDRIVVTVPPEQLDRLAGDYRVESGPTLKVIRKDDHLLLEQKGQPPIELYPESETKFFAKTVDLQTEFQRDAQGQITGTSATVRGQTLRSLRIDHAEAAHDSDALAKRVRDQTPVPGGDVVVRQLLESLAAGKPSYDKMSDPLAAATRQQLPAMQPALRQLGAIQSVSFKSVAPNGADVYEAAFEGGKVEMRIFLGPDGKIVGAGMRPVNQ